MMCSCIDQVNLKGVNFSFYPSFHINIISSLFEQISQISHKKQTNSLPPQLPVIAKFDQLTTFTGGRITIIISQFLCLLIFAQQKQNNNQIFIIIRRFMKFLTTASALLAVMGAQAYNSCNSFNKEDLIQSGVVDFVNGDKTKESCFNVNIDYHVPSSGFEAAVSTVSLNGYRLNTGLDYSVRASRKGDANALAISLLTGDNQWKKITVSYLVSSRKDLHLGSYIADAFSLFGCDHRSVDKGVFSHTVPSLPQGKIQYQVATYISGIRTSGNRINAKLWDPSVDSQNGVLNVKVTSNANPSIENLHVSYVIWNKNIPFDLKTFKPDENINADYQLVGITSFQNSNDLTEGLAFLSDRLACIGGGCKAPCTTTQGCRKQNGKVINGVCVNCGPKQKLWKDKCVPDCGVNQVFEKGNCVCVPGFIKLGDQCVNQCGLNEQFRGGKCQCKNTFVKHNNVCKPCPKQSVYKDGKCVCLPDWEWNNSKYACEEVTATCPPKSKFDKRSLTCVCSYPGQYLINGSCQSCKENEGWNGDECVCKSDYYKINGWCRTCDVNSTFNGRDCVCNHGFFGNADKCQKCHPSCGKCSGPGAHQCKSCSDVSYDLKKGYCTRNAPCPTGLYLNKDSCQSCSAYCASCESEQVCKSCVTGFEIEEVSYGGKKASFCSEKCGDGRRYELECDDDNNRNGDGCSKDCKVEKGWTCQGGSSIRKSTCAEFIPNRSVINPTGTVNLFGRVVQGVRLSYIPNDLVKNNCAECSKLLWVRVISSDVIPGVRVNYMPKSKYQFLCEFDFNGLFSIPVFSVSIQINPDYAKYFSPEDMAQIQVKHIDPAVLKKIKPVETLSFYDIDPNEISGVSDQALENIFDGRN